MFIFPKARIFATDCLLLGTRVDGQKNLYILYGFLEACLHYKKIEKKLYFDTLQYWLEVISFFRFRRGTTPSPIEYFLKFL